MANEHAIQATGTFVVSKGFRLLTKLAASQGSLQFTRAAVGTGKPPEGYSPESMIGLNAYKIDAEIADYGVQDDMAYITVQVSSDNVTEGFLVTEVGVFAEDPDEGEILYGYMDISTDPTYIYANGSTNRSKFAEFTLYVLIGSVSNVIAAVTPGSIITRDTFTAANLKAIDTHGILGGEAGAGTTGQGLIDALTNKLLTEFVTNTGLMERLGTYVLKSKIVNDFLSTDEETVLSGPMGKLLKEQLNVLNWYNAPKATKTGCITIPCNCNCAQQLHKGTINKPPCRQAFKNSILYYFLSSSIHIVLIFHFRTAVFGINPRSFYTSVPHKVAKGWKWHPLV